MPAVRKAHGLSAVILCGSGMSDKAGVKLDPLVSVERMPKALLPIANKPMIQYPLEWLQTGTINDCVIVCFDEQVHVIQAFVDTLRSTPSTTTSKSPKPLLHMNVNVVATGSIDDAEGTAAVFRHPDVHKWIKSDFIVVPCDLVCEIPLNDLMHKWMSQPENLGGRKGGLGVWYNPGTDKALERDVIATKPVPESTVILPPDQKLVHILLSCVQQTDSERKIQDAKVRYQLIHNHGPLMYDSERRDSHIYILPYFALQLIRNNPYNKFDSLQDDVLPWWVKACWQAKGKLAKKLGFDKILSEEEDEGLEDSVLLDAPPEIVAPRDKASGFLGLSTMSVSRLAGPSTSNITRDSSTRGWGRPGSPSNLFPSTLGHDPSDPRSSSTDSEAVVEEKPAEPLYGDLYIPPFMIYTPDMEITPTLTTPLIRRVDSINVYLHTCLEVARNNTLLGFKDDAERKSATAKIGDRTTIGPDCLIGETTDIADRVLVKRSVVGKNVNISTLAKINGSVILDGAVIGEGVKLEGCIIGKGAKIGKKCVLTNCRVAEGYSVDEETEAKDQTYTSWEDSADSDSESASVSCSSEGSGDDAANEESEDEDEEDKDEDKDEDEEEEKTPSTRAKSTGTEALLMDPEAINNDASDSPDDDDFEPDSDSSYVDEEYDSHFEDDEDDAEDEGAKVVTDSGSKATATAD